VPSIVCYPVSESVRSVTGIMTEMHDANALVASCDT